VREVEEETGLVITNVRLIAVENVLFETGAHYVVLFMGSTTTPGSMPQVREPTKCTEWGWYRWDEFPSPLFKPLQQLRDRGFQLDDLHNLKP